MIAVMPEMLGERMDECFLSLSFYSDVLASRALLTLRSLSLQGKWIHKDSKLTHHSPVTMPFICKPTKPEPTQPPPPGLTS